MLLCKLIRDSAVADGPSRPLSLYRSRDFGSAWRIGQVHSLQNWLWLVFGLSAAQTSSYCCSSGVYSNRSRKVSSDRMSQRYNVAVKNGKQGIFIYSI